MQPDLMALESLVRTCAREELLPRFAEGREARAARQGRRGGGFAEGREARAAVPGRTDGDFSEVRHQVKHDGSIVTAADIALQQRLQDELARAWPEYDFLGEEMPAHEHEKLAAVSARGLWCLDPLDGTSNYAAGVPYFAVSLALVIGGRAELGLVYDPVRDECFTARRGHGAWRNGIALGAPAPLEFPLARCIAAVDFKRLDAALAAKLGSAPPYASQRNFGASSLDWCWLADGRFHIYLHGGQKLWDFAAGSLILAEAGGHSTTLTGEAVFKLDLAPRSVVAARDAALFAAWRDWLASVPVSAPKIGL